MHPDPEPFLPCQSAEPGTARLLTDLPAEWHCDVIGPEDESWGQRVEAGRASRLRLAGLPATIRAELAWMAYWQFRDGCKVAVSEYNLAASVLRWMVENSRYVTESILNIDSETFVRHYCVWFESRRGRLPAKATTAELLRVLYGYPRHALTARLNDGPWWALDDWIPRCDTRIPLRDREPLRSERFQPGHAQIAWVRAVIKWYLGTTLEAGTLTWSTVIHQGSALLTFDRWLASLSDPAVVCGDISAAASLAAEFRRWVSEPANRVRIPANQRQRPSARALNENMRAVIALMEFVANHRDEHSAIAGGSPWDNITETHPSVWRKQLVRTRTAPVLNDEHYVDDQALSQIVSSLPALAADTTDIMTVRLGDHDRQIRGFGDPQTMRILLLQILTGRRASEICMCDFDCLSPPSARAVAAAEGEQIARFHYAQTKIDRAPDTILIDTEVVAVIEEQQQAVRDRYGSSTPRYLFPQRNANDHGDKPISRTNYGRILRRFSEVLDIRDSKGRAVRLSRTHRFRHTRLTQLAELGLPVHVLQRYAGHANPTMSMHYVAQREEHAEQAFLATRKFKADGTAITISREDHDGMHLFDRADRLLPHGYCLLPPLQTCDKGNACLTCSVFVTDTSHLDTLQRQLDETNALIDRTTVQFEKRHGKPMPGDNVWLLQRTAERDALVKLVATLREKPARTCQGAGSPTSGPVPITIDTTSHRKRV